MSKNAGIKGIHTFFSRWNLVVNEAIQHVLVIYAKEDMISWPREAKSQEDASK